MPTNKNKKAATKKAAAKKASPAKVVSSTEQQVQGPLPVKPRRAPGVSKDAEAINRTPTRLATNQQLAERNAPKERMNSASTNRANTLEKIEDEKETAFEELGVPPHRRGENLYEQSPELASDITRHSRMQTHNQNLEKTSSGTKIS